MISKVAVGLDGSATASKAVDMAAELARRFDAELVLLSVFRKGDPAPVDRDAELEFADHEGARQGEMVARTVHRLKEAGVRCSTRTGEGNPGEVLVQLAEDAGADVIVVGNKGMEHRILGSVPNHVTHKAGCSVLVVKTT
ncbi:MAG: universal stress protein [Solirubrobacteraceae bacterium]